MPYRIVFLVLGWWMVLPSLSFAAESQISQAEIEKLVSPIALYPDPLLQHILPASTFPDQITDAALLIRTKADADLIADQSWDGSVKVIAGYPGVLKMMYEKLDWTSSLGQAFLSQHSVVLDSIQELRAKAKQVGNLESSGQQKVTETSANGETVIIIEPANPQVIYVPQTTTEVVYVEKDNSANDFWMPVATFGMGMAMGYAFADNDDHDDHYYYGGGHGIWVDDDSIDHWVDRRQDNIDHALDNQRDRIDNRHDRAMDRQDFRQNWAKDNPDKVNKENFNAAATQKKDQLNQARGSLDSRAAAARETRPTEKRSYSVPSSRPSSYSSSYGSRASGSTWSSQGGGSYANRSTSRGMSSRASAGSFSRGGGGFRGGGGSRGGGRR